MKFFITFFLISYAFVGGVRGVYASDSDYDDGSGQYDAGGIGQNGNNNDVVAQFQVNNAPANVTCYAGPPGSAVALNQNQANGNNRGNNNRNYNNGGGNYNNNGGNYNNGGGNYNNNGGNYNTGGGNYNNNGGNYNNGGQNGFNGSSGNNNNSVNGGTQTVLMPVRVPKGMAQQFSASTAGSNGGGQVCSCPSVTPAPAQSVSVMPAQGGVSYMPGMPTMMGGMIPGGMMGGMVPGMSGGMMMPGYGGGMPGFNPAAGMGGMLSSLFGGLGGSGSMNFGGQGGNFAMGSGGISPDFQQTIQRIFSSGSGGSGYGGSFGGGMNFGGQGADQYSDGNGYVCRKESGIGSLMNNFLPRGMR